MLYRFLRGLAHLYFKIFLRYEVKGKENIPREGGAVICANHIHLLDPAAIAVNTERTVSFLAKKELYGNRFNIWFFGKLNAIPIQRDGTDALGALKAMRVLKSGGILGIFPEGTRERNRGLMEFKGGAAMLAVKTKVPIVPVYIQGRYSPFAKLSVLFGEAIPAGFIAEKRRIPQEHSSQEQSPQEQSSQELSSQELSSQELSDEINREIANRILALKESL